MENNENPDVCSECGGRCCKMMPCAYTPSDFVGTKIQIVQTLNKMIKGGKTCLDCWSGDPREGKEELSAAYYPRPVAKGKEGINFDQSWFSDECIHLTPRGCALSWEDRPSEGKSLIPAKPKCKTTLTRQEIAIAWIPYHLHILLRQDLLTLRGL